jgi:hypothetical protein
MTPQPRQIRAARALLGWNQARLDRFAGAPNLTTHYLESGQKRSYGVLVVNALFNAGIRFVENGVVLERRA